MDRPSSPRKLRIVWSASWVIVCLLLVALWVRSYSRCDIAIAQLSAKWVGVVSTYPGGFVIQRYTPNNGSRGFSSHDADQVYHAPPYVSALGFGLLATGGRQGVYIPFWSLVLSAAVVAVIDPSRWTWRFSLRTLLFATTLAALMLGLLVWAMR
jgi:hypothetical protein